MNLKHSMLGGVALCALANPVFFAGAAHAQTVVSSPTAQDRPSLAGDEDEAIVVTGSLIAGTPRDAALPVDVITADSLEQSGISSSLELIKQLPTTGAVLGDTNQFNAAAQGLIGTGSVNLRGIGSARTLVLMNSRRTISTPGTGIVDTNLIPFFALGRVEVLKDGAATTYGSDAIAGVVNFITRDKFEGIEAQGDFSFVRGTDGDYTASILAGHRFGAVHLLAGFGYQHRSELETGDRAYTALPYAVNPAGYSSIGNPGTYILGSNPNGPYRNNPANVAYNARATAIGTPVRDANCTPLGGVAAGAATPICYWTYVPYDNLVEEEHRYQAFGQMNVDLTDTMKFHLDVLWARTHLPHVRVSPAYLPQQGPRGPGVQYGFFIPQSNPGFATFQSQTGALFPGQVDATTPSAIPGAGAYYFSARAFAEGGSPAFPDHFGNGGQVGVRTNSAYRISGALSGKLTDGLDFDVSATYIRSARYQQITDMLSSRLQNALEGLGGPNCNVATGTPGVGGCMYFNPFSNAISGNPTLGSSNPGYVPATANNTALVSWLYERIGSRTKEDQFVVDAVVSGKLFEMGGGDVKFAVGGQYRAIDYSAKPLNPLENRDLNPCPTPGDMSCSLPVGTLIFIGQQAHVNAGQKVHALFGELNVPFTDRISLQAAVRYEDYGGGVGSTINPKATARWEVLDFLTFRGSVGTTFRGPLPSQVAPTRFTSLAGLAAVGNTFRAVDVIGNPDLKPESAFNWSAGAILKTGGLTLTADYWNIRFKDKIIGLPATTTSNAVAGIGTGTQLANCSSPFRYLIVFANNNSCVQGVTTGNDLARVLSPFVNGPTTHLRGIDFTAEFKFDTMGARIAIGGNASLLLDYKIDAYLLNGIPFSSAYKALGFTNYDRDPGTVSKWRANSYLNVAAGPVNARYNVTYVGGVQDNRYAVASFANTAVGTTSFGRFVQPYVQQDVVITYDLSLAGTDIELQGAVVNLFDRDPPAARLEYGYDPYIGNPIGRVFRIGAKARF